jgi:hypothetical protein
LGIQARFCKSKFWEISIDRLRAKFNWSILSSIDRVLQNFQIFQAIPHEFCHSSLIDPQKLTKASENNKAKGLTYVNQGVQIHNIWHSSMPMKGCWACYKGCWGEWTIWAIPDHIYHRYTRVGSKSIRPFTPWRGVDSPSIGAVSLCLGFWFLNPSAHQVCLRCIDCRILQILFLPYILFDESPFLSLDFLLVALNIFCR